MVLHAVERRRIALAHGVSQERKGREDRSLRTGCGSRRGLSVRWRMPRRVGGCAHGPRELVSSSAGEWLRPDRTVARAEERTPCGKAAPGQTEDQGFIPLSEGDLGVVRASRARAAASSAYPEFTDTDP